MPRRDKDAAENPISTNLRAWQGQAESCPPTCASVRSGGLSGVCSDVACRVEMLSVPQRSRVFCRGRNAECREAHAKPRGLRAPAAPAPPFFGSPKKGGKESSPLATSQGLLPATRYAFPTPHPAHGVARVVRTGPRPKALPPACSRQGQKTPRRTPREKTHNILNCKCVIEMSFIQSLYHDAARRVATPFEERGESVLNRSIPKGKPP